MAQAADPPGNEFHELYNQDKLSQPIKKLEV